MLVIYKKVLIKIKLFISKNLYLFFILLEKDIKI